ncbi:vWA domain-containing protein [Cellulomonas shaoxiangyii]|uniref:VWA domain-containing protein n=1 Tax=Cellulomonas shaoxiangyii TaxID=2566013 RepID=A0A4P7SEP5_9CELL|nr:VWA domain-containing protein [Cellulomonas shaoxiangyii]QCB92512.1 VWA domain-containing protein [Cellulomonas shaoxiangyii]TGY83397.1 VWA domain-containing protein [Cellulomonas shaoxiangyii]
MTAAVPLGAGTTLTTPWAVPALVALAVAALAAGLLWRRRGATTTWVANTAELRHVPAMRAWRVRYHALRAGLVLAVGAAALAAAVLVARPVAVEERTRDLANRDIVLCLDVSGSMIEYDAAVVAAFGRLVEEFEGERVALSLFNSTSRTVFPLTDDYDLVREQLRTARDVLEGDAPDDVEDFFRGGTEGLEMQASLIGDGLATCALLFDQFDADRSRSVVLATDNELSGDPVYSLEEATVLAADRGAVVHGLYPDRDAGSGGSGVRARMRLAVEDTGGVFAQASDPGAVPAILAQVQAAELVTMEADPERLVVDDSDGWVALLYVAGLLAVVLAWRVRA